MTSKSISDMTFEEAIAELESIVKRIESDNGSLEFAINSFERGTELRRHCESQLNEARLKVEKITKSIDNKVKIEDTDLI